MKSTTFNMRVMTFFKSKLSLMDRFIAIVCISIFLPNVPAFSKDWSIVIFPTNLSPEVQAAGSDFNDALVRALRNKFVVHSGDAVSKSLRETSLSNNCRFVNCPEIVADKFGSGIIADASFQIVASSYFYGLRIENVKSGEVLSSFQKLCKECTLPELLNDLTILTEQSASEALRVAVGDSTPVPRVSKKNNENFASPSYWKFGIGLDWDGGGGVNGLQDVSDLPKITDALQKAGISTQTIEEIWSGNMLRLLRRAEAIKSR